MSSELATREKNISQKKLSIVDSASFDTLIASIVSKSEKAQTTFIYRLVQELEGEPLAMMQKYSEGEIRRRARAGTNRNEEQDQQTDTEFV